MEVGSHFGLKVEILHEISDGLSELTWDLIITFGSMGLADFHQVAQGLAKSWRVLFEYSRVGRSFQTNQTCWLSWL